MWWQWRDLLYLRKLFCKNPWCLEEISWFQWLRSVSREHFRLRTVLKLIKTKAEVDSNTQLILFFILPKKKSVRRNRWTVSELTVHQRTRLCRWRLGGWAFGSRKGLNVATGSSPNGSRGAQKVLACSSKGARIHIFHVEAFLRRPASCSWACAVLHCSCACAVPSPS